MGTLTQTIKEQLLDAVGDTAGLNAVIKQYGQSKGPFYHALAQATISLQERFATYSAKVKEAEKACQEMEQQAKTTEQKLALIEQARAAKTKELSALDGKLIEEQELLERANKLSVIGFGPDRLSQLHVTLAKLAASEGAKTDETVNLFFEQVCQYQDIVSLELEAKRAEVAAAKAKADMEKWQAEAKSAEAKTKARKVSIDVTEKLLVQGVKEPDLPRWTVILDKAGVSPDKMAEALEQFACLDKLCQDREHKARELEVQAKKLASQVKALTDEREGISAAIGAIREKALAEVEHVSEKTVENLNLLMKRVSEYRELERQAATLSEEIALARAFKSGDAKQWGQVSRRVVQELIAGLVLWSKADAGYNQFMPAPPHPLSSLFILYPEGMIRLQDVLMWALSGVYTVEEQKALAAGR